VVDALPRQPRNSLSTVQSPQLELSRPNGVDPQRFHDGHERQQRPLHIRGSAPYLDKRVKMIRDDAPHLDRRQSGPTDRRLPEDLQRPTNISLDSDRTGAPPPRASTNDNGRRDPNYDKLKDERSREGSERDVPPSLDRNNVRTLTRTYNLY
jgi:hypothetical protein